MTKRIQIGLLGALVIAFLLVGAAQAQQGEPTPRPTPTNVPTSSAKTSADEARGSIRGTVYKDVNNDGRCADTGEPVLAGIPIEFVSDDEETTLYLQSGDNGTYGLVAAGLGTWKVSARPSAEQGVVTSQPTIEAFLGESQQLVLGVDFCIGSARFRPGPGGQPGFIYGPPVFLPESGASAMPGLWLAALAGLGLVITGVGLHWRQRR